MSVTLPVVVGSEPPHIAFSHTVSSDLDGTRRILPAADERAVVRQRHGGHRRQRPHQGGQVVGDRPGSESCSRRAISLSMMPS